MLTALWHPGAAIALPAAVTAVALVLLNLTPDDDESNGDL